ncbi:MAG: glycosyltransferase 87 family protein [Corynebacterium sp.]|nr:glycosyltransferase 87 family protein [Corynebacterium sp.]
MLRSFPRPLRVLLPIIGFAGFVLACSYIIVTFITPRIDFNVYQAAGRAWLHGAALYDDSFTQGHTLSPYIYPPLAALFFVVLTPFPPVVGALIVEIASLASLWAINFMVLRRAGQPMSIVWLSFLICCTFHPVRILFDLGQIDLILLCLIVADVCGFLPDCLRGFGVGLAGALKLSPALFGMIFLVRRQWPAVIRAAVIFFASIGLTGILNWPQTKEFWLHQLNAVSVVNPADYFRNQSLRGFLSRSGLPESYWDTVANPIFLIFIVIALVIVFRLRKNPDYTSSLLIVCLATYLGSPVSNIHNWVGVVIFAPWLFTMTSRRAQVLVFAVVFLFAIHFSAGNAYLTHAHSLAGVIEWLWNNAIFFGGFVALVGLGIYAFTYAPTPRHSYPAV